MRDASVAPIACECAFREAVLKEGLYLPPECCRDKEW